MDLFDTFTKTLCVGYDNVPFVFNFMVGRLGIVSAPIIDLSGRPVESFLHLTSREVSSSPQAGRQAGTLLPSGEGSNSSQTGSQTGALLPLREGSISPRQLLTFLLGKEAVSPQQLLTFLLGKEAILPQQLLTFQLGKEAILHWQLLNFLPGEASSSSQATAHLPSGEAGSSSQATAYLPPGESNSSSQSTTLPSPGEGSGISQAGNQARSGRQGFRHSTRHRAPQASHGNSTASQADSTNPWEGNPNPTMPTGFPKGLLMKNLTLSGSLTYPTSL